MNLYGFRDTQWNVERDKTRQRVLFVGDSFVEGIMARQEQAIPDHFERLARAHGQPVVALNMGVSAAGVEQYLDLLQDAVPIFEPDFTVVVFYANDFPASPPVESQPRRKLVPSWSRPWSPRLAVLGSQLWRGRPVARFWTSRPFPFLAAVPSERNPWSSAENAERFERFVSPAIADAMKRARFNPYAVDAYGRFRNRLRTETEVEPLLSRFLEVTSSWPTRLLLVYLPHRNQVSDAYLEAQSEYSRDKEPTSLTGEQYQVHARALERASSALGIPFLDLTPRLRTAEAEGRRLYWRYDQHMKEEGYALVATAIFDWWSELIAQGRSVG